MDKLRKDLERLFEFYFGKGWKSYAVGRSRLGVLFEDLLITLLSATPEPTHDEAFDRLVNDVIAECSCHCDDAYKSRGMHGPDCMDYLAADARAIIAQKGKATVRSAESGIMLHGPDCICRDGMARDPDCPAHTSILARSPRVEEPGLLLAAQSVVDGWDAGDDMPEYIEELRKELAILTQKEKASVHHKIGCLKNSTDAFVKGPCTCGEDAIADEKVEAASGDLRSELKALEDELDEYETDLGLPIGAKLLAVTVKRQIRFLLTRFPLADEPGLRENMKRISAEHPLEGSYEEDARYNWPARWDALWDLETLPADLGHPEPGKKRWICGEWGSEWFTDDLVEGCCPMCHGAVVEVTEGGRHG